MLQPHPQTCAIRTGIETDTQHGAIVSPLYLSSTYAFEAFEKPRQYDYARSGNPTREHLATALTHLEQGSAGIITSSGTAAIQLVLLSLLNPNDVVVVNHDCYGGTQRLLNALAGKGLFKVQYLDLTNKDSLEQINPETCQLIWLETPSNPLLRLIDIQAITSYAKSINALTLVDNTLLSPILQNPLTLGADLCLHSTTKYINGHSDVVGGAVICQDKALAEKLSWWANCLGLSSSAFDDYLTLRGIRTLNLRIKQHTESALQIALFLEQHPKVKKVYYPGLKSHPQHQLACQQQKGSGGLISFELDTKETQLNDFLQQLHYFSLAESLGGMESLIAHPATMTHASMSPEALLTAGISNYLFRLSIGLEQVDDLIYDLEQALNSL